MPLVKLTMFTAPVPVQDEHEISVLKGQGLYEYTVGGDGDPAGNAPAKGAATPSKEK